MFFFALLRLLRSLRETLLSGILGKIPTGENWGEGEQPEPLGAGLKMTSAMKRVGLKVHPRTGAFHQRETYASSLQFSTINTCSGACGETSRAMARPCRSSAILAITSSPVARPRRRR